MNRKLMVVGTIILIIALCIAEIIFIRVVSDYEPKISIVFAKVKIDEDTIVSEDMVGLKTVNIGDAHKYAIKSVNEIIGKRTVTAIEENEMILSTRLNSSGDLEDIKVTNKENRLFSIEFKPDQVNAWWLLIGQSVDVIYIPNNLAAQKSLNGKLESEVTMNNIDEYSKVISNLRVAAIVDDRFKQLKNDSRESNTPKYVVLEVSPKQAQYLAYCKAYGKLEAAVIPRN